MFKKQKALRKMRKITMELQIEADKNKLAVRFSEGCLLRKSLTGWTNYFRANYEIIKLS